MRRYTVQDANGCSWKLTATLKVMIQRVPCIVLQAGRESIGFAKSACVGSHLFHCSFETVLSGTGTITACIEVGSSRDEDAPFHLRPPLSARLEVPSISSSDPRFRLSLTFQPYLQVACPQHLAHAPCLDGQTLQDTTSVRPPTIMPRPSRLPSPIHLRDPVDRGTHLHGVYPSPQAYSSNGPNGNAGGVYRTADRGVVTPPEIVMRGGHFGGVYGFAGKP